MNPLDAHFSHERRRQSNRCHVTGGGAHYLAEVGSHFLSLAPNTGTDYNVAMRVIALKTLRDFWEQYPEVEQALRAWHHDARCADWKTPSDIKAIYRNASIIGKNRVVFNIKGNRYRLVVVVVYQHEVVYIRFVGTHAEYDQTDATII